jgi:four helix bundle protein
MGGSEMETGMVPQDISERTFRFALRVIELCQLLDGMSSTARKLGAQLLRSGTSVGANIREARSGQTRPDFIAKYSISLKEAHETMYWLELLVESKLIKRERMEKLIEECKEITAIITTIIKHAKSNLKK